MRDRRYRFLVLQIIVLFCVILIGNVSVFALNTGFLTEDMDSSEQQTFLSNTEISLLSGEPSKKEPIICFDVNQAGQIAVGTGTLEKTTIAVYSETGQFLYGYRFDCGQHLGVQWDGDNTVALFAKSDIAALINPDGEIIELRRITNTIENNSLWNKVLYSEKREMNGDRYILRNNLGILYFIAPSYEQLIKIDKSGKETVIYDDGNALVTRTAFAVVLLVLFLTVGFYYLFKSIFRGKEQGS